VSRPLLANPKRQSEANRFHREVFAMFGYQCALCTRKSAATDAAHVLRRGSHLGPLRYADPRLARPAHRDCHEKVDRGELSWPLSIRRDAVKAHNQISKVKLEMP
jgi:hypothetical protein